MARRVVHTLMGSKLALRTKTGSYTAPSKTLRIIAWVWKMGDDGIDTIFPFKRVDKH